MGIAVRFTLRGASKSRDFEFWDISKNQPIYEVHHLTGRSFLIYKSCSNYRLSECMNRKYYYKDIDIFNSGKGILVENASKNNTVSTISI